MQGQSPSVDSSTQSTIREWTCQRWFHNIAAKVSAKTHRYIGRFVAVVSVPFTFIPSLACDLYLGTKNLHQRTVSEAPVQGQHRAHPNDDTLIREIEKLEKENYNLKNKLNKYESITKSMKDRISLIKQDNYRLENEFHIANRLNSELKEQVDIEIASNQQLHSEVRVLNETIENLTREKTEHINIIIDLKNAVHDLQDIASVVPDDHDLSFTEDDNASIVSNELDGSADTSNAGIQDSTMDSLNESFKSVSSSEPNAV